MAASFRNTYILVEDDSTKYYKIMLFVKKLIIFSL